jgi:muramoyltetrapeptide carboxypeptidase
MASIYLYSPSSTVRDKAAFKRGVQRLKALGHDVDIDETARAKMQRFAGDDATRVAAIARAAASGADIALITRGGYGLTRILGDINYKAIAKSIERGTQWVGNSDFTALQNTLLAKTGAITWSGPSLGEDFGCANHGSAEVAAMAEPDDIMEACFDDLVQGIGEGTGWRLPKEPAPKLTKNATYSVATNVHTTGTSKPLSIQNATLWGGNLSVLTALLGTPYLPQINKGIVFFEDVGEHPYRVERMLTSWLHAGILQRQRAIVLGQFTGFKPVPGYDSGFGMPSLVQWLRQHTKTPILTGLPFGHVPTKVCLPVGATVSLNTVGRDALMFWGD